MRSHLSRISVHRYNAVLMLHSFILVCVVCVVSFACCDCLWWSWMHINDVITVCFNCSWFNNIVHLHTESHDHIWSWWNVSIHGPAKVQFSYKSSLGWMWRRIWLNWDFSHLLTSGRAFWLILFCRNRPISGGSRKCQCGANFVARIILKQMSTQPQWWYRGLRGPLDSPLHPIRASVERWF